MAAWLVRGSACIGTSDRFRQDRHRSARLLAPHACHRLRLAVRIGNAPGVEPLAKLLRGTLDAQGLTPADAARITGLSSQLMSQLLNRPTRYARNPPAPETQESLAKLPGLMLEDVQEAIIESLGWKAPPKVEQDPLRRAMHAIIDQVPDAELPRVLDVLTAVVKPREG